VTVNNRNVRIDSVAIHWELIKKEPTNTRANRISPGAVATAEVADKADVPADKDIKSEVEATVKGAPGQDKKNAREDPTGREGQNLPGS
jgi:hypothetical protein